MLLRVICCDPAGTYAAERACPRRKPSLTQVISSESCIPLPAYFPLAHFFGAFLVQQRGAGECGEIQHRIARAAIDSVPPDRGMGSDFSADAVSWRVWDLHLAAWKIECLGISLGRELAVRNAAIHGHHRVCLYWLASLHGALAHARQVDVCECRC